MDTSHWHFRAHKLEIIYTNLRIYLLFSKSKDLAEYGIRVNAVSPGTIDTPFHAQIKSTKPEVFATWKNSIMLGRLGQPEEVASVVSFLASDDAAFITAETIQIGGGQALGI